MALISDNIKQMVLPSTTFKPVQFKINNTTRTTSNQLQHTTTNKYIYLFICPITIDYNILKHVKLPTTYALC